MTKERRPNQGTQGDISEGDVLADVIMDGEVVGYEVLSGEADITLIQSDAAKLYADQSDLPEELRDPVPPNAFPVNHVENFTASWREFMGGLGLKNAKRLPSSFDLDSANMNDGSKFSRHSWLWKWTKISKREHN